MTPLTAAEANRQFYATRAVEYDRDEVCVVDPTQQARLAAAMRSTVARLRPDPLVLDACGGSGNAGIALRPLGVVPVVVAVSAEMLEIGRRKAAAAGTPDPETHVAGIEAFLAQDERRWDLVTFCSALHHLEDPEELLVAAARRLAPGGAILTMFDPTPARRLDRALRKADWIGHLLLHHRREFAGLVAGVVRRRLDRRGATAPAEPHVGRMAERHAYGGVDDRALVRRLRGEGLDVVTHERYADGRLAVTRALLRALRRPSHFHLVLARPA